MRNILLTSLLLISLTLSSQEDNERYKLYPTENMYTFIKLDTATGALWQVQYGVGDVDALESVLNDDELYRTREDMLEKYEEWLKEWEKEYRDNPEASEEDIKDNKPAHPDEYVSTYGRNGLFKLYPTQNYYNFLLINTSTGLVWQVQWNVDKDKRFRRLIY